MKHVVKYALEMHAPTVVREQTVTQNDAIEFVVTLLKGGEPIDMTGVTPSLAVKRRDGVTTALPGTVVGNTVTFALGSTETAKPGPVYAAVQLYGADGRVSSLPFSFQVKGDLTATGTIPSENEATLIEVVLQDGPAILQRAETAAADAERVAVENKTNWLDAVTTVAERDTAYPSPKHGDTVRVTGSATVYRYEDGKGWVVTDQYQQSAVDALNQQLADKAGKSELSSVTNKVSALSQFVRYGKIKLPSDFPKVLPFDLYRDHDGIVKHTLNLDNFELGAGHIHLKAYAGADSNDGLTEAKPVRLLSDAIAKANALPQETVILHLYDDSIDHSRSGGTYNYTLQKNLIIKSHAPSGRTAFFSGYRMNTQTWTKEDDVYYGAAVPYSLGIAFDGKFKDYRGTPKKMQIVDSVEKVKSTPNSVHYGEARTYIHTLDKRPPDASIMLLQDVSYSYVFNLNNKRLVLRDIHFVFKGGGNSLRVNGLGTNAGDRSEFYYENCVFTQSKTNGIAMVGVRDCYGFDSTVFDAGSDGFNYHALSLTDAGNEFGFEYNCEAFNCGKEGDSTSNATTAHEGMTMLRVGSVGYNTYGPVLADVNGCYSVCIDCTMFDSLRPTYRTRAGFYFDESGEPARHGKAYLINCSGGGKDTWTVNTDGLVEVYIQKLQGDNIPTDLSFIIM